jgi:hypothetical protein
VDPNAGGGKPLLPFGKSRVRVLETKRSTIKGDTFFATVEIVSTDAPGVREGYVCQYLQSLKDQWGYGSAAAIRFVIGAGDLDEAEVETMLRESETGESLIDACCGLQTKYGENPLAGRLVDVVAVQGKPDGRGDHYRDCTWTPVPDQD